ncbi:MAG: J domain-containing protein [Hormoscilla sp. SP5CHS1]|nr:J domain-containing protein [Hormoscilla sp. SP12CHS1]MBC6454884.1 J domain-containing protein [Hormoscilla sp. SP5CHS1]MBC6473385.1 J domain-containing protein [Hormoscilla sp. GM102CHS1]
MTDVAHYYRILELEPGASLEEIHQGYKDLAIVWHPDRFVQFPRLQQKAHEKMRQINEARDRLRSILTVPPTRAPQPPKTRERCAKNRAGHSGRVRVERPKPADYKRTLKDYIKAMEGKQPDPSGWLD